MRSRVNLPALWLVMYLSVALMPVLKVPCTYTVHHSYGVRIDDEGYRWLWDVGNTNVALPTVMLEETALLLVLGMLFATTLLFRKKERDRDSEAEPSPQSMPAKVLVWVPFDYRGEEKSSLAIPVGSPMASIEPMTQTRFVSHLEDWLNELFMEDPKGGHFDMTGSVEHSPDFYTIGMHNRPEAWAPLITQSDQLQIALNRVDWSRGRYEVRSIGEVPSLMELLEQLTV